MKKHPGTAGLIPVKGTGCGIRPDPDALENSEGFDFSEASQFLDQENESTSDKENSPSISSEKSPKKIDTAK